MSIMYCERHAIKWDSDLKNGCPFCEGEPSQAAMEAAKKAYESMPDGPLPSNQIEAIAWCIDEALEASHSLCEQRVRGLIAEWRLMADIGAVSTDRQIGYAQCAAQLESALNLGADGKQEESSDYKK